MLKCLPYIIVLLLIEVNIRFAFIYPTQIRSTLLRNYNKNEKIDDDLSNEKVRDALKYLKENDKDWLNSVIGDSLDYLLDNNIQSYQNTLVQSAEVSKPSDNNVVNAINNNDKKVEKENNEGKSEIRNIKNSLSLLDKELLELGYSLDDISCLKENLKSVIIEKKVLRPRKGLPANWVITSRDNAVPINGFNKAVEKKMAFSVIDDSIPNSRANKFRWKGAISDDEKTVIKEKDKKTILVNGKEINEDDDIEPLSFWPDLNEFKDMLIDESKFRINLAGDWTTPLVKSETKLRYNLYKFWLDFLNQGVGDTFDVIDDDSDIDEEVEPISNKKQSSTNAKAKEYNQWIQSKISKGDEWSDLSQEQLLAKRSLKSKNKITKSNNKYKSNTYDKNEWFKDDKENLFDDEDALDDQNNSIDFKEQWEISAARKPTKLNPPIDFSKSGKQNDIEYNREVLRSLQKSSRELNRSDNVIESDEF